nr:MAG TPA: virion morphogenesis protein [Caudoviricetes sp.]
MVKVIDRDLGYTVAVKNLEAFAGKSVEAGIFANAGINEKTSLADIAVWNEYGVTIAVTPKMRAYFHSQDIHLKKSTTRIRIPARPFMRQAADKNATKWGDDAERLAAMAIHGMSTEQALEVLGVEVKGDIQDIFTSGSFAPNAELTIQKKGSSRPLIDSGRLRASVDFRIK